MIDIDTIARIVLEHDADAESPRDWENVGHMACWHNRYRLGDEQPKDDPQEWRWRLADDLVGGFKADWDDIPPEHCDRALEKHLCVILPLYLYDHSGITMSTGGFSCPWDSGQVGYIYVTWERARKEWCGTDEEIRELATRCLESEVKTYAQYLEGDVWGFALEDEDGEWVDYCGGFYGDDPKENGMWEHWSTDVQMFYDEHGCETA